MPLRDALGRMGRIISEVPKNPRGLTATIGAGRFVVLLPEREKAGANEVAEGIQERLQRLKAAALPEPQARLSVLIAGTTYSAKAPTLDTAIKRLEAIAALCRNGGGDYLHLLPGS